MAFSISYVYELQDRYSRKIDTISRKTQGFTNRVSKTKAAVGKLTSGLATMQTALGGVAATAAAIFPTKAAIDFEAVMADVSKVIDLTPRQFRDLKSDILKSAIAMGRLPVQIARIAEAGGKLGVPIEQMQQFIGIVSRSAVAFDILEDVAGRQIGSLSNKLGLTINRTESLMDAINFLADNTAASGSRMIEIIERTSGVMGTIQMPDKFIAGWAAFADQVEVTPQLAASGLKMVINRMKVMPGMMEKFLVDPNKTLIEFFERFQKMEPAKRAVAVLKVFGPEAGRFAEMAVNKLDLLGKTLNKVADGTSFVGSMQRELQKKLGTTEVKLKRIKVGFLAVAIAIGDAVLPIIKKATPFFIMVADTFRIFAENNPQLAAFGTIMLFIAGGVSAAAIAIGILMPLILAIATPIGLVVAGIAIFSGAVLAMSTKSPAIRTALRNLLKSFQPLVDLFRELFELFTGNEGKGEGIAKEINTITTAVNFLLGPLKLLAEVIGTINDFGIQKTIEIANEAIMGGVRQASMSALGLPENMKQSGSISADRQKQSSMSVNGNIDISTIGGITLERARLKTDMPGNLGFNMGGN